VRVCVVGLGKIGLPLAVQYASKGLTVTGCDIDERLVGDVNEGRCPIVGEEGLEERLAAVQAAGRLRATTDTAAAVASSEVVVIIVPVGVDEDHRPGLSALDAAAEAVARGLRPGALVVLESTVPVGTTRRRLGRALEEGSSLRAGADFCLAFSPERVYSGRVFRDLQTYAKVVGGIDEVSTQRAAAFYGRVLDAEVLPVRDAETAEFAKLAETTYRDVNIALANELALCADAYGIDVAEAIAAANSQPYSHIHQPGVGVGGHCIPVNPYLLMHGPVAEVSDSSSLRLAAASRQINDAMARYGVERLEAALGSLQGSTVLILGLSYRPNVKEAAHSSALLLAAELRGRGARALVHDPLFSPAEIASLGLEPAGELPPPRIDAIIVQALHDAYRDLDLGSFAGCRALLDGRNALERQRVEAAGMKYLGIGR